MSNEPSTGGSASPPNTTDAPFKVWMCILCGFLYEEAVGMPDEGIPAGTRWEDIPEDWICPECSATKIDFEMVEV